MITRVCNPAKPAQTLPEKPRVLYERPGAGVNDKFALVIKRALQSHCTGVLVDKTSTSEELVMNLYLYKPD